MEVGVSRREYVGGSVEVEVWKVVMCRCAVLDDVGQIRPILSCRYTEVVLATRYRGCWYYLYYFLLLFAVLSCYADSRSHL